MVTANNECAFLTSTRMSWSEKKIVTASNECAFFTSLGWSEKRSDLTNRNELSLMYISCIVLLNRPKECAFFNLYSAKETAWLLFISLGWSEKIVK